jgi:hypothetical protein
MGIYEDLVFTQYSSILLNTISKKKLYYDEEFLI